MDLEVVAVVSEIWKNLRDAWMVLEVVGVRWKALKCVVVRCGECEECLCCLDCFEMD